MPYIHTTVSTPIPAETQKQLAKKLGEAITLISGKTERWLMLNFTENAPLYFNGSDAPAAMVEVELLGSADNTEYDALTGKLCRLVSEQLAIPSDRIYVKYEEITHWGWNNANF